MSDEKQKLVIIKKQQEQQERQKPQQPQQRPQQVKQPDKTTSEKESK